MCRPKPAKGFLPHDLRTSETQKPAQMAGFCRMYRRVVKLPFFALLLQGSFSPFYYWPFVPLSRGSKVRMPSLPSGLEISHSIMLIERVLPPCISVTRSQAQGVSLSSQPGPAARRRTIRGGSRGRCDSAHSCGDWNSWGFFTFVPLAFWSSRERPLRRSCDR